jgi:hypothetical protein
MLCNNAMQDKLKLRTRVMLMSRHVIKDKLGKDIQAISSEFLTLDD